MTAKRMGNTIWPAVAIIMAFAGMLALPSPVASQDVTPLAPAEKDIDYLIERYDTNGNGQIDKPEVIAAINDYLFGEQITKAQVIAVINLYLFGDLPAPDPSQDRAALIALYNATDGANWTANENWLSNRPLEQWHGVATDDEERVTQINLRENNLTGTIPSEIGDLSTLEELYLDNNELTGDIPSELGNLPELSALRLAGNRLTGCIPDELKVVPDNDFERLGLLFCSDTVDEHGYYTQFRVARGVTIKSNSKVDAVALLQASKIITLMLDGRQDIADCIRGWDSSFAIFPKDAAVTDLPEFAYLIGQKDIWGRPFDEPGLIFGLGGTRANPVSAASEQSLLPNPDYPFQGYWVAVHELGHHLMNLCFSAKDHSSWKRLHQETIEADLGYGQGLLINVDEFFAGLTEVYFSIHNFIPKRHLNSIPGEVLERLEAFYGILTPTEADEPGYVRYVSESGIPTLWLTAAGGTYEHTTFGYRIELPPGWGIEHEDVYEVRLSSNIAEIRIQYSALPDSSDTKDELLLLAEQERANWEQWTRDWDASEVNSFELESIDGQDSYWIRYYGHEAPQFCEIDRIQRVLITAHDERDYGVVLTGHVCGGARTKANIQDVEVTLRSFVP